MIILNRRDQHDQQEVCPEGFPWQMRQSGGNVAAISEHYFFIILL